MRRTLVTALLLLLASCTATAFAQNATTSLRGVVKDPSGALISAAKVAIVDSSNGQSLSTISNSSGEYQFIQIPPAKYTITVSASGFSDQSREAELLVNQPATVNFALSLTATHEVLNVTADTQTLNTADASLGASTNNATIQALPSETRNVPDLLSLQPGVFYLPPPNNPATQDSRSGAVNGGRSDQGNVTLDGTDDNDQVNGYAFTGVLRMTQDSVEEFRVTTGSANADGGRSSGAQISLVTKSGTNKFHGAAYEYNRPTFTVANDFFNKQAQLNSGEANRPGKLIRNIFGADVGGPILKNKLFFFANYEGSRIAESTEVSQTVPTATYQQGVLQYTGDTGSGTTVTQAITAAQLAALDAACVVCNTAAYPSGPGENPNVLAYFNSEPTANGLSLGDGLNTGSFSFASPNPRTLNTSIVRLDYIPSSKHRIFARGNLQKDRTGGVEQFPGQGPSYMLVDNTKGMTFGDTWTLSSTMVNDVRYSYIRQGYGNTGVGSGDYVDFRLLSAPTAETRSTITSVPVNNIVDNFTWNKGKHTIEIGGNWRLVHQNQDSDATSFNSASTNPLWLGGTFPNPSALGLDPVDAGFATSYDYAYAELVGAVAQTTNVYNYHVDSANSGTLLSDGASLERHYKANEFEYFIQDAWRPTPNLTITYGIRHTILQTPWETRGQEVSPTVDTHAWFLERESAALQGQIYEPDLSFAPSGHYYNRPGYWPKSKDNIAPRFAVAYSPDNKTSIRAGFGIYYDHYGEGLVNTFNQQATEGISSQLSNPPAQTNVEDAPRFTGRHSLPASSIVPPPATAIYPYTQPTGGFAVDFGIDNGLKTPYSEAFDLSVQREIKGGWTAEAAYVGRLGHNLIQFVDEAEPVDYTDPQGGGDYYSAGTQLSKLADANAQNPNASVTAIPFFEHVFPYMANFDHPGESATQAIYTDEWAPFRLFGGVTEALADLDFFCSSGTLGVPYPCPANHQSRFFQDQFESLFVASTVGRSYYNSGQITLRHPMSHGLQTDISYTYSRSIDYGSDAERGWISGTAFSTILNSWKPNLNRAVSDFDTTHLLTVDWVYKLPFGRGAAIMGNTNRFLNEFIGGWQLSGILRATSGLPISILESAATTSAAEYGYVTVTGKVKTGMHFDQNGDPQLFADPAAINSGTSVGNPIRGGYPGEAGERNKFRGDGFFDIDSGLNKSWNVGNGNLKFAWEVYNATNTMRFDGSPDNFGILINQGNLGIASALLNPPRRMQFSLRYDF